MGSILEDLALKLSDVVGIKVNFPLPDDKSLVMKIHARLLILYDDDWALDTASLSCKRIQRLLNMAGIGHLCPRPADVTDPRRLPRLWSAFVSKIEEKYGSSGMYPRLRKVLKKQQILEARREADRARHHGPPADANPTVPPPPRQEASFSSQESDTGFRFARPAARGRHISSSSTVSSSASQSPSKPRSKIPVRTKPNVIPTGRQLMRTPCGPKVDAAPLPPPPGPASPPVPVCKIGASPAVTKPVAAPPVSRTPASAVKLKAKRLSQLVVDKSRYSGAGNISYELVAVAPVRRSVDDSPVKPADSPVDGVVPSPLSKPATPERRKSLVPVAVSPEQMLGQYIEDQLNTRFPDQEQSAEVQGELALPPQQESAKGRTFTPEKNTPAPQSVSPESASLDASGDKENALPGVSLDKEEYVRAGVDEILKAVGSVEENCGAESKSTGGRRSTFDISPASRTSAAPDVGDAPVVNPGLAAGEEQIECAPAPVDPSLSAPPEAVASGTTMVDVRSASEEDACGPSCDGVSQAESVKAKVAVEKAPAKRRGRAKKNATAPAPVDSVTSPQTDQSSKGAESSETTHEPLEATEGPSLLNQGSTTDVTDAKPKRNRGKKTVARRTASGRSQTDVPEQKLAAEVETAVIEEPGLSKTTKSETEIADSKVEAEVTDAGDKKKTTARRRGRVRKEAAAPEPVSCDVTTALPTAGSQTEETLEAERPAAERAKQETPVDGAEKDKVPSKRKTGRERKKAPVADVSKTHVDVELSSGLDVERENEVDHTTEATPASMENRETEKELPRRKPRGKKKQDDMAETPAASVEDESNELAQGEKENLAAPKRKSAHPRKARNKKERTPVETPDEKPVQTKPDIYDSEGEPVTAEATAVRRRPARGRKQRELAAPDVAEHGSPAGGMALRLRSELAARSCAAGGASPARPRRAAAKKAAEALHVPESPLPEPRLRRLRVARDSDSTPPEVTPPRRAAKPSARPRRALQAVENCD